jgi:hypothetical protein
MTDKKILEQLKGLKSICLSEEVRKENKSVLLSQISNTSVKSDLPVKNNIFNFKNVFSLMYRPALVVAGIFVFLSGALVVGGGFYDRLKPNDSLYIARIISEKARVNTTFNKDDRELLLARFASNHARDIANILMDPEFNTEENQERVERLSHNFQNEISKVRGSVEREEEKERKEEKEETVISASSLKDDEGIEISVSEIEEVEITITEEDTSATSSEEEIVEEKIEASIEKIDETENGSRLIEEIESLFAEKRFEEVVEKLDKIDEIIKR